MANIKLENSKKALIDYLLDSGKTQKEIAKSLGVSLITIKRYCKEQKKGASLGKDIAPMHSKKCSIKYIDYNNKDNHIASVLEKEKILFEDEEEGWVYSTSVLKRELKINTSGLWWSMIVYPDSAPKNWKELLIRTGYEIAISPLHDKDKWDHNSPAKEVVNGEDGEIIDVPEGALYKKGDAKKSHWHVIVKVPQRISFREMNTRMQDMLNCPLIHKCNSLKGMYQYFIHLNNPEKYQYEENEIEKYNGFILEANERERKIILKDVVDTIRECNIENYDELVFRFSDDIEYLNVIIIKAYALKTVCDSIWRKNHPDYSKVVTVKYAKEEKEDK